MPPFRTLIAGFCAAAIASPAIAAGLCMQPAEKTAFEVHSLQSALMVAALNCRQEEEYNGFVRRFQRDLGGAYRGVQTHFRRTGGGIRKLDEYITNLANAHSQDGIRQGSLFCENIAPIWQQVMALGNGSDLAQFSVQRSVTQIYAPEACATRSPPVRTQHVRAQPPQQAQTAQAAAPPR